jgi:hypothetical protein
MIDYRSHVVAVDSLKANLVAKVFADAAVTAERDQQIKDVNNEPGWATLGSLMDHLLRHASSDGLELTLLEKASSLWNDGLNVHTILGDSRLKIETALLDPAHPASATQFNEAIEKLRLLSLSVVGKPDGFEALRREIMKLAHIPEHPRQLDQPLNDWRWGDVFMARRTDAFLRTVYAGSNDPSLRSFAFGVLSGYSANARGSAYLGQVVGGPRRSHRFRHRVAGNVVGSWLAQKNPMAKSLASIAKDIRLGDASIVPSLPSSLASFIEKSLKNTFDLRHTAPLPDLQTGYARLVRHLELLDTFNILPPAPIAPADVFLSRFYADPRKPSPPTLTVAAATQQEPRQSAGSVHPTNHVGSNGQPDASDKAPTLGDRCGNFWMAILTGIVILAGGWIPCLGQLKTDGHCKLWDDMVKEWNNANKPSQEQIAALGTGSAALSSEDFQALAGLDQFNLMVKNMFELHNHVWEGLGKAQTFLATYGLIYPDGMLAAPVFNQFLSVPTPSTYPARPEVDPVNHYHEYPATPTEHPLVVGHYPPGTSPDAFIGPPLGGGTLSTAAQLAVEIWSQIATGEHVAPQDSINFDLEADRCFDFKCWATLGSINADPVGILTLSYEDT